MYINLLLLYNVHYSSLFIIIHMYIILTKVFQICSILSIYFLYYEKMLHKYKFEIFLKNCKKNIK